MHSPVWRVCTAVSRIHSFHLSFPSSTMLFLQKQRKKAIVFSYPSFYTKLFRKTMAISLFSDNTFSKKLFRSLSGKRHFFPGYPCSIALQLSASDCDQAYAVLLSYPVSSFLIIHPAAIRSCKHGNLLPDRLRKIKNRMFGEHTGNQHNAHIRTSFSFAGR